jgi:hypothetical protein
MKRLLFNGSAIIEALTGFALLVVPLFVIGLLLGDGLGLTGVAVPRILGIGMIAVAVAGWELQEQDISLAPRAGLCIYNAGVAIALVLLGANGGMNGILLWPVAILHAVIGAMMVWVILAPSRKATGQ